MNGHVDEQLRPLIPIRATARGGEPQEILAWIDTAFNGSLVIPQAKVDELQLMVKRSRAKRPRATFFCHPYFCHGNIVAEARLALGIVQVHLEEDVAAVQAAIYDMNAGDTGRDAARVEQELRDELNLPAIE